LPLFCIYFFHLPWTQEKYLCKLPPESLLV
jgi:hypothetical protein